MLTVQDEIDECTINEWRAIDKRDPRIAEFILIHRIDVGRTPRDVAEFFAYKDKSTGGRMPYHFFVSREGVVSQCVPLSMKAPGARGGNRAGIQVALDGDFRKHPATPAQALALNALCKDLVAWKPTLKIEGHTDAPGRAGDADKICPGPHLVVAGLARNVAEQLEKEAKATLKAAGVRF